jgi:hypothetical protein
MCPQPEPNTQSWATNQQNLIWHLVYSVCDHFTLHDYLIFILIFTYKQKISKFFNLIDNF